MIEAKKQISLFDTCQKQVQVRVDTIVKPTLIGCEESGTITTAFRRQGVEAYSCDLKETRGNEQWHFRQDIMNVIATRRWRLIVLHPDCTAMAVSGNRWYGRGMPRHQERIEAIEWTIRLWELAKAHADSAALENPVSVIFKHIEYDELQYVQPWQFGHGETKKTGFALHNLPPLKPTNIVDGREQRIWKMPPSDTRKRDRSKTFSGIADAIAEQWA